MDVFLCFAMCLHCVAMCMLLEKVGRERSGGGVEGERGG